MDKYCKTCKKDTPHRRTQFGSWYTFSCNVCDTQQPGGGDEVPAGPPDPLVLASAKDLARQLGEVDQMLAAVLDAHYGLAFHHIGDGDGIEPEMAKKVAAWWMRWTHKETPNGN